MLSAIAASQVKVLEFDWIICHFGPNGVLANKLRQMGVLTGKIATVFHGLDMSVQEYIKQNEIDYHSLFQETELQLPISHLWRDKLINLGATPNKVIVHRMGVDLKHFDYKRMLSPERETKRKKVFDVFTVARFTEKKGIKYAIESLGYLPDDLPVCYKIAGYGKLKSELENKVKALGLSDKVIFCGALSSEQVKNEMLKADVFLQPSITASNGDMEGVPVSIMESMAIGTPVISTFHSGIPKLLENDKSGLLVPEKNAKAIAEKLHLLYKNITLNYELAEQARIKVESISDIKKLNEQLVTLLASN